MRYTYLVGTAEQLNDFDGVEFTNLYRAREYAQKNNLSIIEIEWEFSGSAPIS